MSIPTTILNEIDTPFLLIDKPKFIKNIHRMRSKLRDHDISLRPHLKTLKSIKGAPYLLDTLNSAATVSTLKEAEVFAEAGYNNLVYAVGISAQKLPRIKRLIDDGIDISILLDSVSQANAVVDFCNENQCDIPTMIEIDCDDHRAGIKPHNPTLLEVANVLYRAKVSVRGVLTHAGGSYNCTKHADLLKAAEHEKHAAIAASQRLIEAGIPCPVISVGSTPTALSCANYDGITEVRAGVFQFFDLVMAGIGVCTIDEIALSVVTTVIGHNIEKNWLLIDAGWMALSRDKGTSSQPKDCEYGLVCDINGTVIDGLQVTSVNQEHGIITCRKGTDLSLFKTGATLRILPNHACATAAMHLGYQVFDHAQRSIEYWPRIQGW